LAELLILPQEGTSQDFANAIFATIEPVRLGGGQWEIPPEAAAQLIPAPGTIPPENTLEADGRLDTPEFGEEKQPDYANQVNQNPAVGFQALGMPDEGDLSRQQKLDMLRRIYPAAPADVLSVMVDNTDFGSLLGQRQNLSEELLEEGKEGKEETEGKELGVVMRVPPQAMGGFATRLQQRASGITATTSSQALRQATRNAFTREEQKTAGRIIRQIEEIEQKNPDLAGRIGVIAAHIWENLPSIPSAVRSAIPWLALNIAGSMAGRSLQPVKPGGVDYVTIASLIASLAAAGLRVPEPVTDFVEGEGEPPKVMRPVDKPPGSEGAVPVDERLRDDLSKWYKIPKDGTIDDIPEADRERLVDDVGMQKAAEVIAFVTKAIVGGSLVTGIYQFVGGPGGPSDEERPPGGPVPPPIRLPPKPPDDRVREKAVSIKSADDPGSGDLRPTFQQLGTEEDTESKEEKLDEQLAFATFGYVFGGSGNGQDNPLYLQNKAFDNLVRFVNNYIPAVDRLSENQMRMFQKTPDQVCKTSVVQVDPSVARMRKPPTDWTMVNAFSQPAPLRNGIDTWDLENPNVPLSRVAPPSTKFAEFKQTNQVENPVEGTSTMAVPRGLYSNPQTQAGMSRSTGWTTGKSMLLNVPAPEPIAFTEVNTFETTRPQQPYWDMYETREPY
jgi:hypothetical protein